MRLQDGTVGDQALQSIRDALEEAGDFDDGALDDAFDRAQENLRGMEDLEAGLSDMFPSERGGLRTAKEMARQATAKALEGRLRSATCPKQ